MAGTPDICGKTLPGYEPVADAFALNFRDPGEIGAACCVYVDGEPVVDLWAGLMAAFSDPQSLTMRASSLSGAIGGWAEQSSPAFRAAEIPSGSRTDTDGSCNRAPSASWPPQTLSFVAVPPQGATLSPPRPAAR